MGEAVMCFCEGTRIRTPEGVAEVQDLRVGDRVVTGAGVTCEISWIGRRGYITSAIFLEDWERLVPVRIEQGALGDGMPCNDLLISPDHAVCLENSLVPVRHLLNGDSIAYFDRPDAIRYFQLELPQHERKRRGAGLIDGCDQARLARYAANLLRWPVSNDRQFHGSRS
jgi:Hint domain